MKLRSVIETETASVTIRRELREGDREAIVRMHRTVYAAEYGLGGSFAADVDVEFGRARELGWPDRGGAWMAERGGRLAGTLALIEEGPATAQLRWFLLEPALRGQGLGARLLGELIAEADAAGYRLIRLKTFSELRAAAHLYRSHGFAVVESRRDDRWGRELELQSYERRRA